MIIPDNYFNATLLLASIKDSLKIKVKVSQFTDNKDINQQLANYPPLTKEGCAGYTLLHKSLYEEYHKWLQCIGDGK